MLSRRPFPPSWDSPTNQLESQSRKHVPDPAEESLIERWTKLGESVLSRGAPTKAHISEKTALARTEQERIKRKLRPTAKVFDRAIQELPSDHTQTDCTLVR